MSFFDGFDAGDIFSAAATWLGAEEQNRSAAARARDAQAASAQEAEKLRDWQEKMDNSKYQRGVADLSAAGLNPMLAYHGMSGSTPSGATGMAFQAAVPSNSLGSAAEAFQRSRSTSADVGVKDTQSDLNKEAVKKIEADIDVAKANVANLAASTSEKLQNARTGSAVEARERVQAAAIQDQRARDSALAPLYNLLERGTQWIKDKANKASSAYDAYSKSGSILKHKDNIPQITIKGTNK